MSLRFFSFIFTNLHMLLILEIHTCVKGLPLKVISYANLFLQHIVLWNTQHLRKLTGLSRLCITSIRFLGWVLPFIFMMNNNFCCFWFVEVWYSLLCKFSLFRKWFHLKSDMLMENGNAQVNIWYSWFIFFSWLFVKLLCFSSLFVTLHCPDQH